MCGALLLIGLSVELASAEKKPAPEPPAMLISVYDRTGMPPRLLSKAGERTTRIFRKAGIAMVWLDCWPGVCNQLQLAYCSGQASSIHLVLTILPEQMAHRLPQTIEKFGIALAEGGRGSYAYVFFGRIEKFAKEDSLDPAELLGTVAAHEIGHLMLGPESHTASGIMAARWGSNELMQLKTGNLLFSDEQSDLLRRRLASSVLGAVPTPASTPK